MSQPTSPTLSTKRQIALFAAIVLCGVTGLEVLSSVQTYLTPMDNRSFPQGCVSRGIWSAYALVRPPDRTSTDIAPTFGAAAKAVHGEADLYADFDPVGSSFIYPPSAAVLMAPFGWLNDAAGVERTTQAMDVCGRLATVVLLLIALWYLRGVVRGPIHGLLAVLVFLSFFPMRWSLFCVQAQTLLNAMLAGALLAYGLSRNTAAGVLVGLVACVKPHYAALVLFGAVRKQWRFAGTAVVTGLIVLAASVALLGVGPWRDYAGTVLPVVADGYAKVDNQSFNGVARRWAGDTVGFRLDPASTGVRALTLATTVAMVVVALVPRFRNRRREETSTVETTGPATQWCSCSKDVLLRSADIGIAMLALTMASPVAWNHHYGWAPALFAVALASAALLGLKTRDYVLLAIAYVLMATSWQPVLSAHCGPVSLLNSLFLFGAILLLWFVWRITFMAVRRLPGLAQA